MGVVRPGRLRGAPARGELAAPARDLRAQVCMRLATGLAEYVAKDIAEAVGSDLIYDPDEKALGRVLTVIKRAEGGRLVHHMALKLSHAGDKAKFLKQVATLIDMGCITAEKEGGRNPATYYRFLADME